MKLRYCQGLDPDNIPHVLCSLDELAGIAAAFNASFPADLVADLPEQFLPVARKRQQYICSVFSGAGAVHHQPRSDAVAAGWLDSVAMQDNEQSATLNVATDSKKYV